MDGSKAVKTAVLNEEYSYLCNELGDPGRYFPHFRSKNLLDNKDCERIRSKATSSEKTELLLEIVMGREGPYSEHPLDILISELKKQRVQVHIARRLQRTLKRQIKDSGGEGFQRQQSHSSQSTDSLDDSPTKPLKGPISDTGPTPPTPPSNKYEINPEVGEIPNCPPPLSTQPTVNTDSDQYHPEYGMRPPSPPPVSTIPKTGHYTDMTGYVTTNGHSDMDSEQGGQSGCTSLNTDSFLSEFTSGPPSTDRFAYQSNPDLLEREKLQAAYYDLREEFSRAQYEMKRMNIELQATKQELSFYKQENIKLLQHQEGVSVSRPGVLFPQHLDQQYTHSDPRYLRQPSPGRSDAHHSLSSQGDASSIRSATSSTSMNSNPSLASTPRTHMQSYV